MLERANNANPKVKTPKRPMNIIEIITILPNAVSPPVMPTLSPTVEIAEITSNMMFCSGVCSENDIKNMAKNIKLV